MANGIGYGLGAGNRFFPSRAAQLAQQFQQENVNASPIRHPMQGFARAIKSGAAGYLMNQDDQLKKEAYEAHQSGAGGGIEGSIQALSLLENNPYAMAAIERLRTTRGEREHAEKIYTRELKDTRADVQTRTDANITAAELEHTRNVEAAELKHTQDVEAAELKRTQDIEDQEHALALAKANKLPTNAWRRFQEAKNDPRQPWLGSFQDWIKFENLAGAGIEWTPLDRTGSETGNGVGDQTRLGTGNGEDLPVSRAASLRLLGDQNVPRTAAPIQVASAGSVSPETFSRAMRGTQLAEAKIIPGGPADIRKREIEVKEKTEQRHGEAAEAAAVETKRKAKERQINMERAGGTVVQDAGRALEIAKKYATASGFTGWALKNIPGEWNPAHEFLQHLNSIRSNTGINEIVKMKQSSPTGGALGQIPVQQQEKMEQLLGNIIQDQKQQVLIDNLERIQNLWLDMVHGSPAHIEKMYEDGKITKEFMEMASFRHKLSFDYLGRSKNKMLPGGVTEAEVKAAMQKYRLSREEVIKRYRGMNGD